MEQYRVPNKLPSEEINILAQRKGRLKQVAQRSEPAPRKPKYRNKFLKIESVVAKSRIAERDAKRIRRNFLKTGFRLKGADIREGQLIVVFRHHGTQIANKDVRKVLNQLNLPFVKAASFHKLTPDVHARLKIVEPFVIWGYPKITIMHDLIFKYGKLRSSPGQSQAKALTLSSNKLIEEFFGSYGIICVDDLIHEIMTVGTHFDQVKKQFKPFRLSNPVDGWQAPKGKLRIIGGEAGFRGEQINDLFLKLL